MIVARKQTFTPRRLDRELNHAIIMIDMYRGSATVLVVTKISVPAPRSNIPSLSVVKTVAFRIS